MDLELDIDLGQTAAPNDGARPEPYESNGAAWHDAFCLLQALKSARGLYMRPGDRTSGDRMVREFARRLRASGPNITLHRVQRYIAITDERLILCTYGMAIQYGVERDRGLGSACIMAVGFDPARIRRVARLLTSCLWAIRYEHHRGGLFVADWFLDYISGGRSISDDESIWIKDRIRELPTIQGREPGEGDDAKPNA